MRKRAWLPVAACLAALTLCAALAVALDGVWRTRRETRYADAVLDAAVLYDVPPSLVMAVIRTESDFRPKARSGAGAVGLMQLLPDTFRYLRDNVLKEQLPDRAIEDPAVNIRYGTYYLSYLLARFGDLETALAAYNAGEGNVAEWPKDGEGRLLDIPFPETADYVKKVLAARQVYQSKYKLA